MSSWYQVQRARLPQSEGWWCLWREEGLGRTAPLGALGCVWLAGTTYLGVTEAIPTEPDARGFLRWRQTHRLKSCCTLSVCLTTTQTTTEPNNISLNDFWGCDSWLKASFCKAVFVEIQICIRSPDTTCTEPDKPWNLLSLTPVPC